MSNNTEALEKMREFVIEQGRKALRLSADHSYASIKESYMRLKPIIDASGKRLSKIDPSDIEKKIEMAIDDTKAIIYINGVEENLEARRQAALSPKVDRERNPFLGALYDLQNLDTISAITGLGAK